VWQLRHREPIGRSSWCRKACRRAPGGNGRDPPLPCPFAAASPHTTGRARTTPLERPRDPGVSTAVASRLPSTRHPLMATTAAQIAPARPAHRACIRLVSIPIMSRAIIVHHVSMRRREDSPRRASEVIGEGAVKYNQLSSSDLKVSELGLGTMTWGEQNTRARGTRAARMRDSAWRQLHRHGRDVPGAARSEDLRADGSDSRLVARQARARQAHRREQRCGTGPPRLVRNGETALTIENIQGAVEDSLKRLRTDYIDLYQIHWPERNVAMFGTARFDVRARKSLPRRSSSNSKRWMNCR
jgi:hypothetical protein